MGKDSAPEKYNVGYKKPPKHSQFQKGRSGNQEGRKKNPDFFAALAEVLNEKMPVVDEGVRKQIPKMAVIIKQLINRATSGDVEAMRLVARYTEKRGIQIETKPATKVVYLGARYETEEERRRRMGARYYPASRPPDSE